MLIHKWNKNIESSLGYLANLFEAVDFEQTVVFTLPNVYRCV
jgi:hypothetical protein